MKWKTLLFGISALYLAGCGEKPLPPIPTDLTLTRRIEFVRKADVCVFEGSDGKQYNINGTGGIVDYVQTRDPSRQIRAEDLPLDKQLLMAQKFSSCVYDRRNETCDEMGICNSK